MTDAVRPADPDGTTDPDGSADPGNGVEQIRDAVLACPDVAGLAAGTFGEVASYLPGHKVAGLRVDDGRVEVHIVAGYGRPLSDIADDVGRAVTPLLGGRSLTVAVDDILLPGETFDTHADTNADDDAVVSPVE